MIRKSGYRFSEKIMLYPEKSSREIGHHGVKHRKSGLGDTQSSVRIDDDGALFAQHGNTPGIERAAGQVSVTLRVDAFGEPQSHQQKFIGALFAVQAIVG